jgi:protein-disulfide isomerase
MTRTTVLLVTLLLAGPSVIGQQPPPPALPQLVVTSAVPDPSGRTLTIKGANFGPRPLVTLELIPLTIRFSVGSQIVADAPLDMMPAGHYLLTVSRGPSPAESGSIQVELGRVPSKTDAVPADQAATSTLAPGRTEPAAKVGDHVITVADVDQAWQRADPGGYIALMRQLYENRRRIADAMMSDELIAREAAARGLTPQALLDEEIPRRVVTLPDSAVLALYQSLGDRARGATLEQMRPALRAWLARNTEPEMAKMAYVEELMKVSTRTDMLLAPPRVALERTAQDPALGPASAPVEIVAFGDFESAEYARFARAFTSIRDTFGERVRLVFKHLPANGAESAMIAEAASCANAQGKFWPYHDAVLGQPGPFDAARLKQLAAAVGIDRRRFDACLDGGEFGQAVLRSVEEAARYGITASPAFLVNGALAASPPPFLPSFDFFKRVIEEELARQSRDAAKAR